MGSRLPFQPTGHPPMPLGGMPHEVILHGRMKGLQLHCVPIVAMILISTRSAEFQALLSSTAIRTTHSVNIAWTSPPSRWIKLNTNGSASGNSGRAGPGGILRNEELRRHFREFQVQHVYREGNKVADALARIGQDTGQDLMYFDIPPSDVAALVTYDAMGMSSPRFVQDHTTDMVGG
ncbi:hypothetical protein CRG98_006101 [Punica granatum]|uniref:RNase H type-1 domain-containing protein n=1 Tax=Punica granatum TaxID=22663 RepID=A0A2I0KYW9_PUNGR|nr:hypothetical protein CRG98_006101 [Punica granatum]